MLSNGTYLIGATSFTERKGRYTLNGVDSTLAKNQLLCLSQNQTAEVLSADYVLTTDVTFDINFNVAKTYQDKDGNESVTKDAAHPFLKTMTATISSNGEDWDGDGTVDGANTAGWIPLGSLALMEDSPEEEEVPFEMGSTLFTGSFDGYNHKIKNLYINRNSGNMQGFFGATEGSSVKDIAIIDSYILGNENIGILAGSYVGTISNSSATGDVSGQNYIGGLIGNSYESSITSSYAIGDIRGYVSNIGGFVGSSNNEITLSYATGRTTGGINVGGFIGKNNGSGSITKSYAEGYVESIDNLKEHTGSVTDYLSRVGGFVGQNDSIIKECYV